MFEDAEIIYAYTRKQALVDGEQVDVSSTAREAGITFPVFLTRTVFDQYVTVPPGVTCQDEAGRLWDIVWMLRHGIMHAEPDQLRIEFKLFVLNRLTKEGRNRQRPDLITLAATIGAVDIDNAAPAITVMLTTED